MGSDGDRLGTLRFSLAGVQLKFSARATERGLVLGYAGDRIVKLADQRFDDVPANESAMSDWARASGLDVPQTELVAVADLAELPADLELRDDRAFVISRFDRSPSGRIHQEDLAQVLGLSPHEGKDDKYAGTNLDTILRVVATIAPLDTEEMLRRLVFMVLSANTDMHAKNWSIVYPDGHTPRLSPAYDQVCTDVYLRTGTLALGLDGKRRIDEVLPGTFVRAAERAGLDAGETRRIVAETTARAVDAWPTARTEAPAAVAAHLDAWLARCPLTRPSY